MIICNEDYLFIFSVRTVTFEVHVYHVQIRGAMEISEEAVIVNSSRLKSVVWNDFDRVKKGETYTAVCRHCKKKLSGSSTSGTSHLRNHLIRCRRRSNHDVAQLLSVKGKKKEVTVAFTNYNFDQEQGKVEKHSLVHTKYEREQTNDGAITICNSNFDNRGVDLILPA